MNIRAGVAVALFCCAFLAQAVGQGPQFRGGRGPDAQFAADRDDFHFLLAHHDQIRRQIKEVPGGVETITESDKKDIVAIIQKHVAAMYRRMENNRPIRRRDPLFAELFQVADKVTIQIENTPQGVRVVATSEDAYATALIRAHAQVVSQFVQKGFEEARKNHPIPNVESKHAVE